MMKVLNFAFSSLACSCLLAACSSTPVAPPAPEWTHQAARKVDNGYIVYVGKGESARADDAQFKAEGLALEDLANECSVIPKGTRVEDRFSAPSASGYTSYVKVALEFQECDEAVKATDPDAVRRVANVNFTEQLKKYQDMEETGFRDDESSGEPLEVPTDVAAAPAQGAYSENVHFYMVRQYVAYQKEVVVLAPPTTYAPGSRETVAFNQNVVPATQTVATLEQKNPTFRSAPVAYHEVSDRPHVERPANLRAGAQRAMQKRASVARPAQAHPRDAHEKPHDGQSQGGRKKRRRRG